MFKKYLSKASYQAVFIGYNFLPINAWKILSNPATKILEFLNPTFRTTELYYERLQDNIYLIK